MLSFLSSMIRRLQEAGIEQPEREIRLLLQHVLGCTREELVRQGEPALNTSQQAELQCLAARRAKHEPMSHLLGRREFYGRDFIVTADVLDPRPDTETLIEAVLEMCSTARAVAALKSSPESAAGTRILDLGTGSGCILLTLLAELPEASGVGLDISEAALAVARENAKALGVEGRATFQKADFSTGPMPGRYDIVVSNPPYIPTSHIEGLMQEVAEFEPEIALDGGKDGLDCYRKIATHLPHMLAPDGFAALEIGSTQANEVAEIFSAAGFRLHAFKKDLAGHARCIVLTNR